MTFLRDVSYNFTKQVTMLFCGLVSSVVVSRVLGPTDRGVLALVMLIPSMLLLFGDLGIPFANVYFLGKKRVRPRDVAFNSLVIGLLVGSLLALGSILLLPIIGSYVAPGVPVTYSIIAISVLPFSLAVGFLASILVGLQKIREACIITMIISVGSTAGTVFVLLELNGGVEGLLILSLITGIAVFVFFVAYIKKVAGYSRHISQTYVRESANYGSKAYLANALNFFNRKLSYFILGYFLGALDVGYFAVAIGLAEMIWIIPSTVSFVLFPSVASTDSTSAGDLTAMSCRFVFFVSTTICVAAAALGGIAIHILYGDPFAPSYLPLVLLLPGILLASTGSLTSSYLAGIGKVIYAPIIDGTGLLVAIILNLLLIPSFGIVGASIATSICYAYTGLLGVHFFRKHSELDLREVYLVKRSDISILIRRVLNVTIKDQNRPKT